MTQGQAWMGTVRRGFVMLSALLLLASAEGRLERRVAVSFSDGYETDPRDHGRPVALVSGALGIKPEIFREAFSHVTPSRGGPPSGDLARRNKAALLGALAPYGITNERLDEVSDYYRYRPERGESWPSHLPKAFAVISNGRISRFEIEDAGSGFSSPPLATVPGFERIRLRAKLAFDQRFQRNGSLGGLSL